MIQDIQKLIERGAIFYCSHSGGKDSQAMYAHLTGFVPADQLVVVHADLGDVEWAGTQEHIHNTVEDRHPLAIVRAIWADGSDKTLLGMVERRGMWPSSAHRQCTSDLKRGPIYKFIRRDLKARGATLAVNCMGLRAEESTARSKLSQWKENKLLSKAGREIYDWLPLLKWTTAEVFDRISRAGQQPHWAYATGNERLSCMFCIMGSKNDLHNAAVQNPELAKKYLELEDKIGHTFFHKSSLKDLIATDLETA
jgi:3'-phosphoadenosine 5'-phosphosulfate sulfotransferase (PAPS reductase)/FAD synthetase